MIEDKSKLNYKKKVVDGVVRETWKTPEGQKVDAATTVSYNQSVQQAHDKQGPGQDVPKDIPSSQDLFGNTRGADVPPMSGSAKTDVGEMISTQPAYGVQGKNSSTGKMNGLGSEEPPKRMRMGGEALDILTILDKNKDE